jgi:hypothetical protein
MATVILRLEIDPTTKKKNVVIKYESDSDALPMEHEETHKRLLEQLIAGGALKESELGNIVIEREGGAAPLKPESEEQAAPTRTPVAEKGK